MSYKIIGDDAFFVWDSGLPRERPFRLRNADVATFEAFGLTWARDAKHVWACGHTVRRIYAPAFKMLNESFACDNECVFDSVGRLIRGMNPRNFEALGLGFSTGQSPKPKSYARHEGSIYHFDQFGHKTMRLRGADSCTFEVLPHGFARDKRKVFRGVYVAKNADPAGFRLINELYWTDGRKVFYLTREVPGADPATLVPCEKPNEARDYQYAYACGKRVSEAV